MVVPFLTSAQTLPFQSATITVSPEIRSSFITGGRLLLFVSRERERKPMDHADVKFGFTLHNWNGISPFILDAKDKAILHADLAEGFIPVPKKFYYLQPESRTIYGEPKGSMKDAILDEDVLSRTNDYRISGEQFGAYNAVFGPRGKDGLPTMLIDPVTGKIDHNIAAQWEKYDLKKVLEKNWSILGPKLQGKIWIWTGDMDMLTMTGGLRL